MSGEHLSCQREFGGDHIVQVSVLLSESGDAEHVESHRSSWMSRSFDARHYTGPNAVCRFHNMPSPLDHYRQLVAQLPHWQYTDHIDNSIALPDCMGVLEDRLKCEVHRRAGDTIALPQAVLRPELGRWLSDARDNPIPQCSDNTHVDSRRTRRRSNCLGRRR